MSRPLQVSLVGGSLASIAWRVLEEVALLPSPIPAPFDCPVCPAVESLLLGIDLPSLGYGILIGLALGPVVDFLCLLRVWWSAYVREQLGGDRHRTPLYRVLS